MLIVYLETNSPLAWQHILKSVVPFDQSKSETTKMSSVPYLFFSFSCFRNHYTL